jgi:hypothetical protein
LNFSKDKFLSVLQEISAPHKQQQRQMIEERTQKQRQRFAEKKMAQEQNRIPVVHRIDLPCHERYLILGSPFNIVNITSQSPQTLCQAFDKDPQYFYEVKSHSSDEHMSCLALPLPSTHIDPKTGTLPIQIVLNPQTGQIQQIVFPQ